MNELVDKCCRTLIKSAETVILYAREENLANAQLFLHRVEHMVELIHFIYGLSDVEPEERFYGYREMIQCWKYGLNEVITYIIENRLFDYDKSDGREFLLNRSHMIKDVYPFTIMMCEYGMISKYDILEFIDRRLHIGNGEIPKVHYIVQMIKILKIKCPCWLILNFLIKEINVSRSVLYDAIKDDYALWDKLVRLSIKELNHELFELCITIRPSQEVKHLQFFISLIEDEKTRLMFYNTIRTPSRKSIPIDLEELLVVRLHILYQPGSKYFREAAERFNKMI